MTNVEINKAGNRENLKRNHILILKVAAYKFEDLLMSYTGIVHLTKITYIT